MRSFLRYADTPSWSNSGLTQIALTEYRNRVAIFGLTRTRGSWIQDTRLGYSRNEAVSRWLNEPTGGAAFYSQNPSLAADFSNIVVGGAGTVSAGQSGRNLQNQWQASYNSAWETSRHQLRLGIEYLELQPVRNGPAESATVAFGTPTNIIYGPLVPIWITYSRPSANSTHLTRASAFVEDTWRMGSRISLTAGIRASYPKPPSVRPGSSLYSIDDSVTPVLLTPIQDRQPLWIGPSMKYAPRVAVAWRLPGRDDTVLRASWSLFQDLGSATATDQLNGIPCRQLSTPDGGPEAVYDTSQLLPVQLAYGYARNLRLPTYQRWNLQLQHEWRHRDTLAVSYAGLAGTGELRREIVLNPTPEFGGVIFSSSSGSSRYHGLNVLYRRPLSSGVQASIGYTWSHSLDLNSSDSSVFVVSSTSNPSVDRGGSDFDVRHVFNAALTYATPIRGRGIAGRLASHWTLGTIFFARSGFPIDVLVSETLRGFAIANYRPTQFAGVPAWISNPAAPGGRELNRNAFGYPLPGLVPLGRNTLRGFGVWQSDVSAERAVWKGATREISFRADAFNITNSPRFSDPARYASNPMFGQSQSALNLMLGGGSPSSGQAPAFLTGTPRSIQTSLRFSF